MPKTMVDYVRKYRKSKGNEIFKNRYKLLKENGFGSEEANKLKFRNDLSLEKSIKERKRSVYNKLIQQGFTHKEAQYFNTTSDIKLAVLVASRARLASHYEDGEILGFLQMDIKDLELHLKKLEKE